MICPLYVTLKKKKKFFFDCLCRHSSRTTLLPQYIFYTEQNLSINRIMKKSIWITKIIEGAHVRSVIIYR